MEHKQHKYLSAADLNSYRDMDREESDKVYQRHKATYEKRILNYSLKNRSHSCIEEHRNIVVGSETGDGKSSTANTILGRKAFNVSSSSNSSSTQMSVESCNYEGRTIKVADTPGIHHTSQDTSDIISYIKRKTFELDGGINCFAICLSASDTWCTDAALQIIEMFHKSESDDRDILIFTKADAGLNDYSLDVLLERMEENENFKDFVNEINHRVIAVNSKTEIPAEQERNREKIIAMMDKLVEDNRQHGRSGIYKNKSLIHRMQKWLLSSPIIRNLDKALHPITVLIDIIIAVTGDRPDSVLGNIRNLLKLLNIVRGILTFFRT